MSLFSYCDFFKSFLQFFIDYKWYLYSLIIIFTINFFKIILNYKKYNKKVDFLKLNSNDKKLYLITKLNTSINKLNEENFLKKFFYYFYPNNLNIKKNNKSEHKKIIKNKVSFSDNIIYSRN